jgi:hypothetical protein
MHVVLETKRQADLRPLLADLQPRPGGLGADARSLVSWFRNAWSRLSAGAGYEMPGSSRHGTAPPAVSPPQPGRSLTTGLRAAADVGAPLALQFPRGSGSQFSIGRDASCDLAIADMSVSRQHATLERTADGWLLSDLASTNGTRVNGWRVKGKVPIRAGDLVSFGNLEAVFYRGDELARRRGCPAARPPGGADPPRAGRA